MIKLKAIVLGGTHDHITLIENLKSRGYYTILIDYYDNPPAKSAADCFIQESTLDREAVLKIAEEKRPDMVISTCIDQALLTMAYVCEKLNLSCHISYQTALNLTNKAYMKNIFFANGIPSARHTVLENDDFNVPQDFQYPLVVKPSDSNGSKGISKIWNAAGLSTAIGLALRISKSKKIIVEEFREGDEYSVDVILDNQDPIILLVSKNIKIRQNKNNFTILQSICPAPLSQKLNQEIKNIAKKIATAFGLKNTPMLIQLIVNAEDVSVIEFSARIGGGSKHHFVKRLTGFDILEYFINILNGKRSDVSFQIFSKSASMNYVYARPGIFHDIVGLDKLLMNKVVENVYLYKTFGMNIDGFLSSADRPAGFMTIAENTPELIEKLKIADRTMAIINDNGDDIMIHGLYTTNKI